MLPIHGPNVYHALHPGWGDFVHVTADQPQDTESGTRLELIEIPFRVETDDAGHSDDTSVHARLLADLLATTVRTRWSGVAEEYT